MRFVSPVSMWLMSSIGMAWMTRPLSRSKPHSWMPTRLTNVASGAGSNEYGAMHAKEVIAQYCAVPAVFKHRALLINVNRTATDTSLYESTRYAWKISKAKAEKAEVVLATRFGLIVGAFVAHEWREATAANFPGHPDRPGRWAFIGEEAPTAMVSLYVGKRVPDEYRKPGAANPIKYTWSR